MTEALGGRPVPLGPHHDSASFDFPTMQLGRLAVDRTMQGTGLGKALLRDAILRTLQVADQMVVRVLVVHAIDATARAWHEQIGFEPSPTNDLEVMLLITDARKTLGDA